MTSDEYVELITNQYSLSGNFVATVRALVQGSIDQSVAMADLVNHFSLDLAVGVQLDQVGLWVGFSRRVKVPIPSVFFSFDNAGLGFDLGVWQSPNDATTGLVFLDDATYRLMLRSKILANQFDGTNQRLQSLLQQLFAGLGYSVFSQDNQDMSITIGIAGTVPTPLQLALLTSGLLIPKPEGVLLKYLITSVPGAPLFGFDLQNSSISGFDTGAWGV